MNFTVNGQTFQAQNVRELQQGVQMDQVLDATFNDGHDSIIFEQDGKEYIAWGDEVELSEFTKLAGTDLYQMANVNAMQAGGEAKYNTLINQNVALAPVDKVQGIYNGKAINVIILENEVNSAGEGAGRAWDAAKAGGKWLGKTAVSEGWKIAGAGMTLGMFARWGGATSTSALSAAAQQIGTAAAAQGGKAASQVVGTAASQAIAKASSSAGSGLLNRAGSWAFGPAKDITFQAGKGFGKAAKYVAIGAAAVAVVGTTTSVIHGGNRSQDDSGMKAITK